MDTASLIAQAKESAKRESADLLYTFSFVPDEKLAWSPSESSRSPLWIVGHCGAANVAFATGLRGEALPTPANPEDFGKSVWMAGHDTKTREEAIRSIEESTAAVLAALDGATAEQIGAMVQTPFGPMPYSFWMSLAGLHMGGHARQIDYLQTIWGDLENHMVMQ